VDNVIKDTEVNDSTFILFVNKFREMIYEDLVEKEKEWRLFNQKRKRMRELLKNMESVQNGVNLELQKVHVLKTKKI